MGERDYFYFRSFGKKSLERNEREVEEDWAQFHQRSTCRFNSRSSQKGKKIDNFTVSFTLLGSAHVKAVRRTLMKLTPGRNKL